VWLTVLFSSLFSLCSERTSGQVCDKDVSHGSVAFLDGALRVVTNPPLASPLLPENDRSLFSQAR
jgi:hypothetical protein